MKAPKFKLVDNDMWDPHVIGSNLSSSHPPHKGQDTNEMRALGASGHRLCSSEEAAPELRTGEFAQQWKSGVEGGSAVVEIGAGGRWVRLCLYGVGR
jgi:hypothetical protein